MYRMIQYTGFFVAVVLLQVFLFDSLRVGFYLDPFIYLAFIILLPVDIKGYSLLLLAAVTGLCVDFLTGTAGVSTASTVFAAFCRPSVLRLMLGDELDEGGVPDTAKMRRGGFLWYSLIIILLHNIVFFSLETLSSSQVWFTALRIAVSAVSTLIVVYACQSLFSVKR